jgi:hypothetical protein
MRKFVALMSAAAVAATTGYAPPAVAQEAPGANLAEIVVYGNDPCPRSTDDQVVVCSRRPEAERYRLPPKLRPNGTRQQNESWARRSQSIETAGATGINSCSAVGPAGYTGCLIKVIKEAKDERKQQADEETPPKP